MRTFKTGTPQTPPPVSGLTSQRPGERDACRERVRCYPEGEAREEIMLDAYIIDRIRKEREAERQRGALIPLRIETPPGRPLPAEPTDEDPPERGSVVIDFQL